jgi:potassium/hydrogen antiporter
MTLTFSSENILLIGSLLLFISIVASKTSFKLGIAQFLGVVALNFILFSGGLDTKMESIKPVLKDGISLSTIGVLITAIMVGVFSSYLLGYTIMEGMLLGAIVSSTDAAAVFSILRSRSVGLKGNIRPLLEFESGSNDPMAYFLTVSLIGLVKEPDSSIILLIPKFFIGMAIGGVCGYLFGRAMTFVVNKIKLEVDGLYPVLILAMVFFTFSFTDRIHGNGFLAVYVSAIILGNSNFIHKKSLTRFYDGQAWLMQIVMFLAMGLLVFPKQMVPLIPHGLLLTAFLIFVARPVAVFIALARAKDLNWRKKLFISWVGLRGAVPIIFATYPMMAGVHYANTIFNLVFFISATSVLLQGTTLPIMAKWLHVSVPEKLKRKFPLDVELKDDMKSSLVEVDVPPTSPAVGKAVVDLNLPKSAMIVLIHRNGKYLTATGETVIEGSDHLLVLTDNKSAEWIHQAFTL